VCSGACGQVAARQESGANRSARFPPLVNGSALAPIGRSQFTDSAHEFCGGGEF